MSMKPYLLAALVLLTACTIYRLKLKDGAECSGIIMLNGSVQCCETDAGVMVYSSAAGAFVGTCVNAKAGPLSVPGEIAIGGAVGAAATLIPLAL